jgi:glucans biosynthesis protein
MVRPSVLAIFRLMTSSTFTALANLAKAPRCGARTRAGHPCKQAAVRGRATCRMHGGAKGSGGPQGNRNGNFKHGLYTHEAKTLRRAMQAKVREIKGLVGRCSSS